MPEAGIPRNDSPSILDTEGVDHICFGVLPVNCRAGEINLPQRLSVSIRFSDLVNTADEILAKPGYGIAAERVTHRKPLVTIDRSGFRETGCLRDDLAKLGPRTALSLGGLR